MALCYRHFPAGEKGFFRAPVLITGPTEAMLIDGGFTYSDGRTALEAIRESGRKLTTIYISQSDPDYHFSLKPIKDAMPEVKVLAASATVDAIELSVEKKLAVWGPQLTGNGPESLPDVVIPEAFDGQTLSIDDETIEVIPVAGLANRRYLWAPSLRAVFGGVLIFSGVHVWTADTPTADQRAAWIAALDSVAARNPLVVVPGHMSPTAPVDCSGVRYTKSYLAAFEEELHRAKDSAGLARAMEARFPGLGMGVALEIGSKVATGEMKWG